MTRPSKFGASKKTVSDVNPDLSDSVSEVDAEDIAKILKGADDIDDELFGFSKNKSPKQSSQAQSFRKENQEDKKTSKKVGFGEFDDSDPLGDISLSDDEFYGIKSDKGLTLDDVKPLAGGAASFKSDSGLGKRPESSPADLKDKSVKSKLIKDLFGLDDNEDNGPAINERPRSTVVVGENKKSDWLGIKESPKKTSVDDLKIPVENDVVQNDITTKADLDNANTSSLKNYKQTDFALSSGKNLENVGFDENDFSVLVLKKQQTVDKSMPAENKSSLKKNLSLDLIKKDTRHIKDDVGVLDLISDKTENSSNVLDEVKKGVNKSGGGLDKKGDLTEEFFGKGNSRTIVNKSQDSKLHDFPVKGTDTVSPNVGQYMPSSSSSRRPGFGRRRNSGLQNEIAEVVGASFKRTSDGDVEWLDGIKKLDTSGTTNESKMVPLRQVQQIMDSGVGVERNVSQTNDSLPSWLGGGKDKYESNDKILSSSLANVDPQKESVKVQNSIKENEGIGRSGLKFEDSPSVIPDMAERDIVKKDDNESQLMGQVLSASSALSQQSVDVMKQTESQLVSVLQMKQQQDMIKELCNRQKQLLVVQHQQIEQLVKQQVNKQLKIDQQMKDQHAKINILLQSLINEVQKPVSEDFNFGNIYDIQDTIEHIPKEDHYRPTANSAPTVGIRSQSPVENEQKNIIAELEISLSKLKMKNASLEQHLENLQARHAEEMNNMDQYHRNEILHWEVREERLKESHDQLVKDFEVRIARLHENELRLIEQHEMRVETLQKERLADLKQVGEFHRLAMEQVASVGKMLLEDTRLVESKRAIEARPLDESQLSAREVALLRKEKEINALKENVETQRMILMGEREDLEEKLDVEKREHEEKLRQLKREQIAFKMKEEEFIRELDREKELIKVQKKQIEDLRQKALMEQTKAIEEMLRVTASQARLEALAKLQGSQDASVVSSLDLVQARAEVEGALIAAREEMSRAEEEKRKFKEQRLALESEKWRLQEWEQELLTKTQFIQDTIKVSENKREEGVKALEEVKQVEKKLEIQSKEIQNHISDLNSREDRLMKEKLELAKERALLDKRRAQLETVLPPLSPLESLSLGISSNRNFVDPKKLIMKLKAEKELELSAIKS